MSRTATRPLTRHEEDLPPQPRSNARVVILIMAALAAIVILVAGAQLFWARHHLVSGSSDLSSAIRIVRSPSNLRDPSLRGQAISTLASAQGEFSHARNDLLLWSPLLGRLGRVPALGKQLESIPPAAAAAYFATTSALDIIHGVAPLWPIVDNQAKGNALLARLGPALAPGRGDFLKAHAAAASAGAQLATISYPTGSSSLDRGINKLNTHLPQLRAASQWLAVAPTILGWHRPARYLVALENPAEQRATGGFIGASETVTLTNGHMTKRFYGSILPREIQFRHLPAPEAILTAESSWLYRDANFSPDFPTSALLERWFWGRDTGTWVNGVVDFVDHGMIDLLKATGPVWIPQYHVSVNASNAQALANRYASPTSVYHGPSKKGTIDTVRKQFLGFEFAAVLKHIERLPLTQWSALGSAMGSAIARHDILLYSRDSSVESAIRASGADGTLGPTSSDLVYVVDDNRSYNKIAPYVHEYATYHTQILPNLWQLSVLTIHYHLNPSPANLEGQGPYFGTRGLNKHDYLDFLRVYVPAGAILQGAPKGLTALSQNPSQPAYGLTQFSGYFLLHPRQSTTVSFAYQIPADAALAERKEYQLNVPRQPGSNLAALHVTVEGISGVTLRSPLGPLVNSVTQWMNPLQNDTLRLGVVPPPSASAQFVPRAAPPSNRDPYIPWTWLRSGHGL